MTPGTFCESCMMPFSKDTGVRENTRYCSLCFKNGKFVYEGDLKGFKDAVYRSVRGRGMDPVRAWLIAMMAGTAPRWKK